MLGELVVKLNAETSGFSKPITQAKTGLENLSSTATNMSINLGFVSTGLQAIGAAASSIGRAIYGFTGLATIARFASAAVDMVGGAISKVGSLALSTAKMFGLLLLPLKGIAILAKAAATPFLWLGKTLIKTMIAINGFLKSTRMIVGFLGLMSPPIRIVVIGLSALAVAGKLVAKVLKLLSGAVKLLLAPLKMLVAPLRLVAAAVKKVFSALLALPGAIMKVARALPALIKRSVISGLKSVATGIKNIGLAAGRAAVTLTRKLVSSLWSVTKWGAAAFVGLTGWGVKLYADAEQAEVGFATMLKSGAAAKQLLQELTTFSASTPFQLPDLRESAKLLLNAGVGTGEMVERMRILGNVAAGAGKPIREIAEAFSKVNSIGRVEFDDVKQLARKGIPIFQSLTTTMGVTRDQLVDMFREGKVSVENYNRALDATATGTGVFAGGMLAASKTMNGLVSTWKDNFGLAFQAIGGQFAEALNFKGMISQSIQFWQSVRREVEDATPVFQAFGDTAQAGFSAIQDAALRVWNTIKSNLGVSVGDWQASLVKFAATAEWGFNNAETVAEYAFARMQLFGHQAFEVLKHGLTVALPEYAIATGEALQIAFVNLVENLKRSFGALFAYVASGGKMNIAAVWKPLSEGLNKVVVDVPDRIVGDAENRLVKQVAGMEDALRPSLNAFVDQKLAELGSFRAKQKEEQSKDTTAQLPEKAVDPNADPASEVSSNRKVTPEALEKGSVAAFEKISQHRNGGRDPQKEVPKKLDQANKTAKETYNVLTDIKELLTPKQQSTRGFLAGWEAP